MAFEDKTLDQLAREFYVSLLAGGGTGEFVQVTNFPATQDVEVTNFPTDSRTLTERMFAKAPAEGYSLWLDTADSTYIYIAEAPTADDGLAVTFRGIRVTKDASGNPLGKVAIATGFSWDDRSNGVWA